MHAGIVIKIKHLICCKYMNRLMKPISIWYVVCNPFWLKTSSELCQSAIFACPSSFNLICFFFLFFFVKIITLNAQLFALVLSCEMPLLCKYVNLSVNDRRKYQNVKVIGCYKFDCT